MLQLQLYQYGGITIHLSGMKRALSPLSTARVCKDVSTLHTAMHGMQAVFRRTYGSCLSDPADGHQCSDLNQRPPDLLHMHSVMLQMRAVRWGRAVHNTKPAHHMCHVPTALWIAAPVRLAERAAEPAVGSPCDRFLAVSESAHTPTPTADKTQGAGSQHVCYDG